MSDEDPFIAVLKKHFPNAEISEHEHLFTNDFIADDERLSVVDKAAEKEKLDSIEKHLRAAQGAYRDLHPAVKRRLDAQFRENSIARAMTHKGTTLVSEGDKAKRGAHLSNIFQAALYSLTGKMRVPLMPSDYLPEQPSAIYAAKEHIETMHPMTGAAKAQATWNKIAVVEHAIKLWRRYGDGEPAIHAAPFKDFLQDLIGALDAGGTNGWDADSLVDTYRRKKALA